MSRILLATFSRALQYLLQRESVRAVVRFGCESGDRFDGIKSIIKSIYEGIHPTVAGWNPNKTTSSGRCRSTLSPT